MSQRKKVLSGKSVTADLWAHSVHQLLKATKLNFFFFFLTIYSDKLTDLGLTYFKGFVVILVF